MDTCTYPLCVILSLFLQRWIPWQALWVCGRAGMPGSVVCVQTHLGCRWAELAGPGPGTPCFCHAWQHQGTGKRKNARTDPGGFEGKRPDSAGDKCLNLKTTDNRSMWTSRSVCLNVVSQTDFVFCECFFFTRVSQFCINPIQDGSHGMDKTTEEINLWDTQCFQNATAPPLPAHVNDNTPLLPTDQSIYQQNGNMLLPLDPVRLHI